jgi:hypothetical protein
VTTEVKVRHRGVGFHRWPNPRRGREYLGQRHRHEFWLEACAEVTDPDRQIEFHDLKDTLAEAFARFHGEMGTSSCETIAWELLDQLRARYGTAMRWVEVWEDGECGARVTA